MFKSIINLALISLVCSAPTLVRRSGSLLDLDAALKLDILGNRYGKGGLLNLDADLDLNIPGGSRYGKKGGLVDLDLDLDASILGGSKHRGYNPNNGYGGYNPPPPPKY